MNDRRKITKDDLEKRFKALQDDVTEITETKKASITVLAVAGVAAGLLVAYLLGRRGGRRRRGVIEIRR
jgi:malate/lactate dehydrogenase